MCWMACETVLHYINSPISIQFCFLKSFLEAQSHRPSATHSDQWRAQEEQMSVCVMSQMSQKMSWQHPLWTLPTTIFSSLQSRQQLFSLHPALLSPLLMAPLQWGCPGILVCTENVQFKPHHPPQMAVSWMNNYGLQCSSPCNIH